MNMGRKTELKKKLWRDRAEQRLRMCKGCGDLGCMGLVRVVNILSISDAVPVYLT